LLQLSNSDEFKEADASERFFMFSRKPSKAPQSYLQKMLKDFPWLWAVRQKWAEGDNIGAGTTSLHALKFGFQHRQFRGGQKLWVVVVCDEESLIIPLVVEGFWSVLFMFDVLPSEKHSITHLVIDHQGAGRNEVEIFRMPIDFSYSIVKEFTGN